MIVLRIKRECRILTLVMHSFTVIPLSYLWIWICSTLLQCQKVRADSPGEEDINFVSVLSVLTTSQIIRREAQGRDLSSVKTCKVISVDVVSSVWRQAWYGSRIHCAYSNWTDLESRRWPSQPTESAQQEYELGRGCRVFFNYSFQKIVT